MKTFLKIVLVIAIAVVVVNEVGRYAQAGEKLNDGTNQLVEWAQDNARSLGRARAASQLFRMGEEMGIVVTMYAQDDTTMAIYTQAPVTGSWIVGPYLAWRTKKPQSTAWTIEKQVSRPLN